MSRLFFLASSVCILALTGCGGIDVDTVPVSGVVLLDGSPVEGASVTFLSDIGNRVATGKTDASGKFSLKTVVGEQMVDGAVVGAHKVTVAKTTSNSPDGAGERKAGETDQEMVARMAGNTVNTSQVKQQFLIAQRYNNPQNSGLTANVAESGNDSITLEVSSK